MMHRPRRRQMAAVVTSLAFVALSAAPAFAAPADLDTSFDGDGAVFELAGGEERSFATAPFADQAADGSLVSATIVREPCETRGGCNAQSRGGSLDTSLKLLRTAPGGERLDGGDLPHGANELLDLRVIGADAGTTTVLSRRDGTLVVDVLDGALDPQAQALRSARAVCGPVDTRGDGGSGWIADASVRADGTIIAVWRCEDGRVVVEALQVAQGDDDLEPVAGFDASPIDAPCRPIDLALSPSDEIFVLCATSVPRGFGEWSVMKVSDGGGLDTSYGDNGIAAGGPAYPAALEIGPGPMAAGPDGEVVVAVYLFGEAERGDPDSRWVFMRITPEGVWDEEFGDDGAAIVSDPRISYWPERVSIQSNSRILGVGYERSERADRGNEDDDALVIVRLLPDGARDTSWDEDGLTLLGVDGRWLEEPGPITQQADGKLVLPGIVHPTIRLVRDSTVEAPGEEHQTFLSLFRFEGDPIAVDQQPPPQQQQQQQTPPPPPPVVIQQQQQQPRTCTSRRTLRIRLRTGRPKGQKSKIIRSLVMVRGKRLKVTRRNGRLTAKIDLRTLPKGRFAVKIRLLLKDGGKVRETRRYRTCTKKIRRQLKPLRTRAPKR